MGIDIKAPNLLKAFFEKFPSESPENEKPHIKLSFQTDAIMWDAAQELVLILDKLHYESRG